MIQVTKRNGLKQPLDLDKIHRVLNWSVEGLSDVNISDIEMNAKIQFVDGIKTSDIHKLLIGSAVNLITENASDYQYVAGRLSSYALRKEVWGCEAPPRLYDHIKKCVELGFYEDICLKKFTESEIHKINSWMKHDRDYNYPYAGIQQMIDKYLVKDRSTGISYETPQFAYIMIAMTLFADYDNRMEYIKKAYDYCSTFKINLPTPILAGVRTPNRQYASCVLIETDDSLDSIFATSSVAGKYVAARAGIGLHTGKIRQVGAKVRNGEATSTGLVPFLKLFESSIQSTSQGGIRKGSATQYVEFFHPEIMDVIVLKSNTGTDDNRVRKLDHSIILSKVFYERVQTNSPITLFSTHECPELYQKIHTLNGDAFAKLYKTYEDNPKIKFKKQVPAREFISLFSKERLETGRVYCLHADHANTHSSFTVPVKMSNLCVSGDTKLECMVNNEPLTLAMTEVVELVNMGVEVKTLSYNIQKDVCEFKSVTNGVLTSTDADILEIEDIESGYILRCTPCHEVFTKNRGYVKAQDLTVDDQLIIAV